MMNDIPESLKEIIDKDKLGQYSTQHFFLPFMLLVDNEFTEACEQSKNH